MEVIGISLPKDITPLPPGIEVLDVQHPDDDSSPDRVIDESRRTIDSAVGMLKTEAAKMTPQSSRVMSPEEFNDAVDAGEIANLTPEEARRDRVKNAVGKVETLKDVQGIIDTESAVWRKAKEAKILSEKTGRDVDFSEVPPPLTEDPVKPGLLQIAGDYLTRPISAVTGAAKSVIEGGGAAGALEEAKRGLTGEQKTFTSDVLKAAGVPELGSIDFSIGDLPAQAAGNVGKKHDYKITGRDVLGFGGDIFADPLTYVTAGTSRALKLGSGMALSTKGEQLLAKELAANVATGMEQAAAREAAEASVKAAVDAGAHGLVDRGGIKWAGMTIPGTPEAADAFRTATRGVASRVRATTRGKAVMDKVDRGIALFNRDHLVRGYPEYVTNKQRYLDLVHGDKLDIRDEAAILFKGVKNEAEGRAITHAVEAGPEAVELLPDHLRQAAEAYRQSMDALGQEDMARGLLGGVRDNYVMHAYTNHPSAQQIAAMPGGVSTTMAASKERVIPTLAEAKSMGLEPVTEDARQLFAMRKMASSKARRAQELLDSTGKAHGISRPEDMTSKEWFTHRVENQLLPLPSYPDMETPGVASLSPELQTVSDEAQAAGKQLYIPRAIYEDMASMGRRPPGSLLRGYDAVNNFWKGSVTSIFPGFHARNAVSNVANSFLDLGVSALNPVRRAESVAVLHGAEGELVTKLGEQYSYAQLRNQFRRHGLEGGFSGRFGIEENGLGRVVGNDNPLFRKGRQVGDAIESEAKMTHFLNSVRRGMTPEQAAARTKQFLFDYGNLSNFERDTVRRAIPFWTFMRKNVPLQLKMLATEPGRQAVFLKAFATPGDPELLEREKRLWPEYVAQGLAKQVGTDQDGNPLVLWGVGLPIEDLNKVLPSRRSTGSAIGATARNTFIGMMAPLARYAVEEATGTDTFSGRPLEDITKVYNGWGRIIDDSPAALKKFLGFSKDYNRKGDVVYNMDPQALHLVRSFILSRVYTTYGKAVDDRKDPVTRLLNVATGVKLGSIDPETMVYPELRRRAEERLQVVEKEAKQQNRKVLFEGLPGSEPPDAPANLDVTATVPPDLAPPAPAPPPIPEPAPVVAAPPPPPKPPKPVDPPDVSKELQRGEITPADAMDAARATQAENEARRLGMTAKRGNAAAPRVKMPKPTDVSKELARGKLVPSDLPDLARATAGAP